MHTFHAIVLNRQSLNTVKLCVTKKNEIAGAFWQVKCARKIVKRIW